jgi:hypothetical protein
MSTILSPTQSDPVAEKSDPIIEKLDTESGIPVYEPSKFWVSAYSKYAHLFGILVPAIVFVYFACNSFPSLYERQPFGALNELLLLALLPVSSAVVLFLVRRNRISQAATIGLMLGIQISLAFSFCFTWLFQSPFSSCWSYTDAFRFIILLAPLTLGVSIYMIGLTFGHKNEVFTHKLSRFAILGAILGMALAFGPQLRTYFFDYVRVTCSDPKPETLDYLRRNATQEELANIFLLPPNGTRFGLGYVHPFGEPGSYNDEILYYRLTGKSFAKEVPPASDQNLGTQVIGSKAPGLAASSSNIDGSFDSRSATASLNWTMTLVNKSQIAQEARALLTLPPGAVVSRVTFWINGQPHEAAFGSVERTKGAYQWIVQKHRDPLLVTYAGDQKVFVQAYPVPAFGGKVKLRIGIKTPLALTDLHHCSLSCPSLLFSNFNDADNVQINLNGDGYSAINSTVHSSGLADQTFAINRPSNDLQIASADYYATGKQFMLETLVPKKLEPSSKTVFVIDPSTSMREHAKEIVDALRSLKATSNATVIFDCEDRIGSPTEFLTIPEEMPLEDGLKKFLASNFKGGYSNESAVLQGLQSAAAATNGTVVWIHGPQPMTPIFPDLEMLGLFRHPKLIDFPIEENSNQLKSLWETASSRNVIAYEPWQRHGSIASNLEQVLHRLYDQSQVSYQPVQEIVSDLKGIKIEKRRELAAELSALWASKEVEALNKAGRTKDAEDLGSRYRIISKYSAATVLERDSDYQAWQLKTGNYVDAGAEKSPMPTAADMTLGTRSVVESASDSPTLIGAVNGTIGPQGSDATVVTGVNTSGSVRVNNLANLEAFLNITAAAVLFGSFLFTAAALSFSFVPRFASKAKRLFVGGLIASLIASYLSPFMNYLIACARDANMFT